jgi:uncharacterized integral membrane protein
MKLVSISLSIIALLLIVFNATKVDVNTPFKGDSIIALITIIASLCVIILLQILRTSKRIEQQQKHKNNV